MKNFVVLFIVVGMMGACNDAEKTEKPVNYEAGSFGYDVQFLQQHDSIVVLANGESQVIVSPKYQAKVFTSSANGMSGKSFGWINYKAFTAPVDAHMNAYGGENRIWLGPEGGQFSLFFPKDSNMVFDNWKTPAAIDTDAWEVKSKNDESVTLHKDMQLVNRIKYQDGVLLFKADGKSRGKLGLGPQRALPAAGSYDGQNKVLTITLFDVDSTGRYLNQEWNTKKPPFSGDAVNAYNDGPLQDGSQMGPFYEIESVSPAAFLTPGQLLTHKHVVLHFTGNEEVLDKISQKVLHISLAAMKTVF